jgi:hypothetical protein
MKKFAIRPTPDGGTVDEPVDPGLVEALCLSDDRLRQLKDLAERCEQVYGPGRDIEWAFAGGELYLLQCRAVTRSAGPGPRPPLATATVRTQAATLASVPLFQSLSPDDRARVAALFKQRKFAAGETVTKEGSDAAAFFVIEAGTAAVTVRGEHRRTLEPGDYFGEIALIDEGARSATVTAETELVCQGITLWDFRPLVQQNPTVAWTLLQTLARRLREATERSG